MAYEGESEYKQGHQLEGTIAPFTKYDPCPRCHGTGSDTYQGIKRPCQMCRGKRKLPVTDNEGRWEKRKVI